MNSVEFAQSLDVAQTTQALLACVLIAVILVGAWLVRTLSQIADTLQRVVTQLAVLEAKQEAINHPNG